MGNSGKECGAWLAVAVNLLVQLRDGDRGSVEEAAERRFSRSTYFVLRIPTLKYLLF